MKEAPLLIDVARRCREIYDRAVRELGPELGGGSVRDLMFDQLPELNARTIDAAIVVAGLSRHAPRPICEVCRDTGGVQLPCAVHPPDNGPGCSCELEEVSCEYCELGSLDRQLRTAGRMLRAMLDAVEAQSHE